jgi:hypothetical protein
MTTPDQAALLKHNVRFPGISQQVYDAVKPYANQFQVPDEIWETVALMESSGNPSATNKSGARGLFQLLSPGGQGDAALKAGYTPNQLLDPGINAKFAMPSIAKAYHDNMQWFDGSNEWWMKFASISGHPYENGTKDDYTYTVGHTLAQIWQKGGQATGPVTDPVGDAIKGVQGAVDTTKNISDFITALVNGGLVKIGIFALAIIFVVVGFAVMGKGNVLK